MGILKETSKTTTGSEKIVLGLVGVLAIMVGGIVATLVVDIFVTGADLVLDPDLATLFATIGGAIVGAAAGYVTQGNSNKDNSAKAEEDYFPTEYQFPEFGQKPKKSKVSGVEGVENSAAVTEEEFIEDDNDFDEEDESVAEEFFGEEHETEDDPIAEGLELPPVPNDYKGVDPGLVGSSNVPDFGGEDEDWFEEEDLGENKNDN